jgi:DNA polymerase-3 subunit alpha
MAALLTCDRDDISKVAKFISECQVMNIRMLPPDVNEAGTDFAATSQGIRFAMSGIKGVGAGVVEAIVKERDARGPFQNFYNFFKRIDKKAVGKKAIENLVNAGSFDFTGWSRDELRESVDSMYEAAQKEQKEEAAGVMTFFSLMGESEENRFTTPPKVKERTSKNDILLKEKELLGFFLTGHPMDGYKEILQRLSSVPLSQVEQMRGDEVFRSAFIVETVQVRLSHKTQKKFAILTVSDGIVRYELPVWADLYEEKSALLVENQLLYAVLQLDKSDGSIRLSCKWLDDLSKADEAMILACDQAYDRAKHMAARMSKLNAMDKSAKKESPAKGKGTNAVAEPKENELKLLSLKLDANQTRLSHILKIKQILEKNRGNIPIQLHFHVGKAVIATLHIDSQWGVHDARAVLQQLKTMDLKLISE